ncbi:glutamine-hydrolyzing GMP synthase [Candidatus Bathyarchaeota archaeon]|nr:glutamine-hydrolyzing GMP synthase [Candidatus Bathyarchaeota archaeon]
MSDRTQRPDTILVLDFGSQYTHLIARRVREQKVYSEVVAHDTTVEEIKSKATDMNVKGLVFSGGPSSVYSPDAPSCDMRILEMALPILGICYGHQLIAKRALGKVRPGKKNEYGITYVSVDRPVGILKGMSKTERVWMSHRDIVTELPEEYETLAHSDNCPVAAFQCKLRPIYGIQWHPEVAHTEKGTLTLRNFIFEVCKCTPNWMVEDCIEKAIREVKNTVGQARAIVALSGGVDSGVAAAIASKAIGRNLSAVLVDHGLMRDGEPEVVKSIFSKLEMNLIVLNEKERFLKKLRKIKDPEEKRRIIGREFMRSFERASKALKADYLIQGTIYPDRIESGFRKHSDKIKTHHNVGGLPHTLKFKTIVEPIRDLYKDEVRLIAQQIGLPKEVWLRQPFPGPGLAVRIAGEVTPEKLEILKRADRIVDEEVRKSGLSGKLWQYFPVLTDTRSTGVKGDARAYGYVAAIRAVESLDGMTASFARLPYELLETISSRMTNEIPEIARVVYDVTHKPPATIEWE